MDLHSRLILGTSRYPSLSVLVDAILHSNPDLVTVALRRQSQGGTDFWKTLKATGVRVLPNTAGCRSAREAVTLAEMAREVFETNLVKLEITRDDLLLEPHPEELAKAAGELARLGFEVLPYTTECPILGEKLLDAGCAALMPWGSPIGSGQGLKHPEKLAVLRAKFPDAVLIVDAGLGKPSHAAAAMELGYDAVLLNTAVAMADSPVAMAKAFALAVRAGRLGYESGLMPERPIAVPSTTNEGLPTWN